MLESLKVKVGNSLEFLLDNGSVRTLQVVGIVQDPSTGAGDFLADPYIYISTESLSDLRQPDMYNRLYATLTTGQNDDASLRQMAAAIKDNVVKSGIPVQQTNYYNTNQHPLASTVQAILGILLVLGVLILFLSSSLIANTLNALLSQHLRHIGVMKLVGGRRSQILAMYIVLILAFGTIALLIAVPLGGQGAYALSAYIANMINFNLLGYRIVPLALVIQIVVGLAVPLLAGLGPVLNGSRITVLRALSGDMLQGEKKHSMRGETARLGLRTPAGLDHYRPGAPRRAHPAPAAHLAAQHLPPARPPGADAFHSHHGRGHLHRGFQCACHAARLHQQYRELFPGRREPGFQPALPPE